MSVALLHDDKRTCMRAWCRTFVTVAPGTPQLVASNTVEEKIYQRQLYKQAQEGLALHQRDETRYFTGVMGDQAQKGELFGIKNLLEFQSRRDTSATSSIIADGRTAFDTVEGDHQDASENYYVIKPVEGNLLGQEDGEADDEADEADVYGVGAVLRELQPQCGPRHPNMPHSDIEEGSALSAQDILRQCGAVHTHLHNGVLGGVAVAKLAEQVTAVKSGKTAAAPPGGCACAPPSTCGAVMIMVEDDTGSEFYTNHPQAAKYPSNPTRPAPKVQLPANVASNGCDWPPAPPLSLHECLCDCQTAQEYFARLATDDVTAWRAEYARQVWGKAEELVELINALP